MDGGLALLKGNFIMPTTDIYARTNFTRSVTLEDLVLKGFDQGRRMGCDEERNRTRHFFHEVLSSKILVASFLAHEIYQKLSASGAEETEDMARLTKLLQEAIDAIVHGAEAY
jgi:hypothetical protein